MEALLKLSLLPRTRFLLATSNKPTKAEGERRVMVVKEWLLKSRLPPERLEGKDIIYDYFSDVGAKLVRADDGPIENSTESKQSLRNSVWIYRMDCL